MKAVIGEEQCCEMCKYWERYQARLGCCMDNAQRKTKDGIPISKLKILTWSDDGAECSAFAWKSSRKGQRTS